MSTSAIRRPASPNGIVLVSQVTAYGAALTSAFAYTLDHDFGPFNTTYTVSLTLTDASGAQTTRTATIATKSPKQPGV